MSEEQTSSPATEAADTTTAEVETTSTTESTETVDTLVEDNGEATEQVITYANGKYKSVSDLEKGYAELQKSYSSKLGGFEGAPEAYELEEGIEASPRVEALQAWGKENQLSNKALNDIIKMDMETTQAAQQEYIAAQKEALGKDADIRLKNLKDWALANGTDESVFSSMVTSAKAAEFLESVMKSSVGATPAAVPSTPSVDAETVKQMRFAKDDFGNRRMSTDPKYSAKVEALEAQLIAAGGRLS